MVSCSKHASKCGKWYSLRLCEGGDGWLGEGEGESDGNVMVVCHPHSLPLHISVLVRVSSFSHVCDAVKQHRRRTQTTQFGT